MGPNENNEHVVDAEQLNETLQRMEQQLRRSEKRNSVYRWFKNAKFFAILAGIIAILILAIWIINSFSWPSFFSRTTTGNAGISLTSVHSEIYHIVLGEARERQLLVVLEQDVEVTNALETIPLINWDVFRMTQTITTAGTGVFTVDMSEITQADVAIDESARVVLIAIPAPVLHYVTIDLDNSTFSDTERGLLAFGEIQLSMEEQHQLNESIMDAMQKMLDEAEIVAAANEAAIAQTQQLYQTLIDAAFGDITVRVVIAE